MTYASISIDRREAYYERAAALIAADPLGFYTRAEAGRKLQSAIRPKDLQPFKPAPLRLVFQATPARVVDLAERKRAKAGGGK